MVSGQGEGGKKTIKKLKNSKAFEGDRGDREDWIILKISFEIIKDFFFMLLLHMEIDLLSAKQKLYSRLSYYKKKFMYVHRFFIFFWKEYCIIYPWMNGLNGFSSVILDLSQ